MTTKYKVGDTILTCDLADYTSLRKLTITKISKDGMELTTSVGVLYATFCFPAIAEAELLSILKTRQSLKKAFDDSMGLIYDLNNKLSRGEVK